MGPDDLSTLEVIAEIALGLAGFSGLLLVLSEPNEALKQTERFRLTTLIYSGFGTLFLALLPLALFGGPWADATVWLGLGILLSLYTLVGLAVLPAASIRLHRDHPDLFPWRLICSQVTIHICSLILALSVLFRWTEYPLNGYLLALVLLLVHGAVAFVRMLFYRRE